jgi:hypothetical protein
MLRPSSNRAKVSPVVHGGLNEFARSVRPIAPFNRSETHVMAAITERRALLAYGLILPLFLSFEATAHAELTATSGTAYAALCSQREVPLPPNFGGPPTCNGCATGEWTYSGELVSQDGNPPAESQSFNGDAPVKAVLHDLERKALFVDGKWC